MSNNIHADDCDNSNELSELLHDSYGAREEAVALDRLWHRLLAEELENAPENRQYLDEGDE